MKKNNINKNNSKLLLELINDNSYQNMTHIKEHNRQLKQNIYFEDEKPILKDLLNIGIKVSSVWDLVNSSNNYQEAIPILVEHLSKPYQDKNKEGIIRALAIKAAKGKIGKELITEYNNTPIEKHSLRWAIGNTMEVVISIHDEEDVIKIIKNKENGLSRQMFIIALAKIKTALSEQTLIDLLIDKEVAQQAIEALGIMKSIKAKNKISKYLSHPNHSLKKVAEKALNKIG